MVSMKRWKDLSVGRGSANDNHHPRDIITVDQLAALRAAGWIVVRSDAIRLAQIAAREEVRDEVREKYERGCG